MPSGEEALLTAARCGAAEYSLVSKRNISLAEAIRQATSPKAPRRMGKHKAKADLASLVVTQPTQTVVAVAEVQATKPRPGGLFRARIEAARLARAKRNLV